MSVIFFASVILKGIGAGLEVIFQVLITRKIGVDGYGNFSTWINFADLIFWVFFSALTKCNTYYLSVKNTSIGKFKRKYYFRYVIPSLAVFCAAVLIIGKPWYCCVFLITGLEMFTMDQSSTLLAQKHQMISLTGEYIVGRVILVAGFFLLSAANQLTSETLLTLYVFQYCVIIAMFLVFRGFHSERGEDLSHTVSMKKWGNYQRADFIQSLIGQMPVIIQYFFAGAFEAGVVSVVLTVKKLINFISGPTAKIFLPEFSRLYREGEKGKICECYGMIMRIQMLFVGPLAVVLIGYPRAILRILDAKLTDYAFLFSLCSAIFIFAATLGPCSGMLQMTGNEKWDNRFREIALAAMVIVMVIFRKDNLFVLYGLCAQALLEEIGKYYYVSKWMGKTPVKVRTYMSWWIVPVGVILLTYLLRINESYIAMMVSACVVLGVSIAGEIRKEGELLQVFQGLLKKKG